MTSYYSENKDNNITRIFIVRHGQTDCNMQKIFQGHKDIPINEEGFEQAQKLGIFMKKHNISFDKIFSSDLIRCRQTLDKMLENVDFPNKEDIQYTNGLRERYMGIIEGMYIDDAEKYALSHGKKSFRDFGESLDEFHQRLSGKILDIFENDISPDTNNIALITHGGSIRNILHWLDEGCDYYNDKSKIIVYNTSVSIVDYNKKTKKCTVHEVGNTEHLGKGEFVVNDTRVR